VWGNCLGSLGCGVFLHVHFLSNPEFDSDGGFIDIGSVGNVNLLSSLGVMDGILTALQRRSTQIQPLIDLVHENNKIVRSHESRKSEVVLARQEIQVLNRELSVKENSVEKVKATLAVVLSRLSRDRL
jgi:hypothetical protein